MGGVWCERPVGCYHNKGGGYSILVHAAVCGFVAGGVVDAVGAATEMEKDGEMCGVWV